MLLTRFPMERTEFDLAFEVQYSYTKLSASSKRESERFAHTTSNAVVIDFKIASTSNRDCVRLVHVLTGKLTFALASGFTATTTFFREVFVQNEDAPEKASHPVCKMT